MLLNHTHTRGPSVARMRDCLLVFSEKCSDESNGLPHVHGKILFSGKILFKKEVEEGRLGKAKI